MTEGNVDGSARFNRRKKVPGLGEPRSKRKFPPPVLRRENLQQTA